jgi:hypothetical protein
MNLAGRADQRSRWKKKRIPQNEMRKTLKLFAKRLGRKESFWHAGMSPFRKIALIESRSSNVMTTRSYGGLIPVDVFTHLGPEWIAGVIYLSGLPWRSAVSVTYHFQVHLTNAR